MRAALNAVWFACSAESSETVKAAAKAAATRAAREDVTREFIRLCRLEGEYGEISERVRQLGEFFS